MHKAQSALWLCLDGVRILIFDDPAEQEESQVSKFKSSYSTQQYNVLEYSLPIIVRVLKYRSARTLVPEGWSTGYQLD